MSRGKEGVMGRARQAPSNRKETFLDRALEIPDATVHNKLTKRLQRADTLASPEEGPQNHHLSDFERERSGKKGTKERREGEGMPLDRGGA